MKRRKHRKREGFTLVEVVVAAVIFALMAVGIYATIAALSKPAETSSRQVTAAFLGKQALEQLRTAVDADDWNSAGLSVGTHSLGAVPVDGVSYTMTYTVTQDASGGRNVHLNITWPPG